ncbi:hypothetical protein DACRYDRAFT_106134 [Dacryopinax primogenitus]|uniref:Uncharacterized protein n=1 Tax=Dacryopinax primogenitus (strain DJM 731) TaxID=1858805 RepID=M5G418_DACPD|nr:uncharacterized protein DACRYDRAFT_106134 [Dacryopinax primogenitus]EJU02955.1 hypothetical protein DACRYDRAFT_106134 [Dacryopinax primogenitus]
MLHDQLRQVDEKRNEALAPVSRLPDDILRLIIQHGHDDEPLEVYPIGTSLVRRVSHMSRRWRAIVLDMASVWTYVRFSNPTHSADEDFKPIHPCYRRPRALNDTYTCNLERSKESLLKVELLLSPYYLLSTIMKEYLQICLIRVAVLNLSVHTSSPEGLNAVIPCITHTRKTLRCVRLRLHDPLSHRDTGIPDTIGALLACDLPRLLEELHLTLFSSPSLDVADAEVQLPHVLLAELRIISCTSTRRARDTFGRLVAPKLESLSLDVRAGIDSYEWQEAYITELLEFLASSSGSYGDSPPVKQLTIQGAILNGLERILLVLSRIEVFRSTFNYDWIIGEEQKLEYARVLNKLVPTEYSASESEDVPPRPPLCPKLKVLESLSLATPRHIQWLTTLAARRCSWGNPLTRIRIHGWPPVPNPTLGMPAIPSEQYRLEKELAKEVEVLECGEFRWEWNEGGRWRREPRVKQKAWGKDPGWFLLW